MKKLGLRVGLDRRHRLISGLDGVRWSTDSGPLCRLPAYSTGRRSIRRSTAAAIREASCRSICCGRSWPTVRGTCPPKPKTGHKVATQSHPLLDCPAPAFVLNDASGKTWNLHDLSHGPVVVVFYLGSTCMACVTHLTELDVAMARFTRSDVRVLAVSGDTPEFSLERMRKYGEFQIPLLSDADHAVSSTYGVWKAAPGGSNGRRPGAARHLHRRS